MAVAGVDVGVGGFAAANTFEPVANVGDSHVVGTGVRGGAGGGGDLAERKSAELIGLHVHFGSGFFGEAAVGGDFVLVEIKRAAVGEIQLLDAAVGISHTGRIDDLKAFGGIVER